MQESELTYKEREILKINKNDNKILMEKNISNKICQIYENVIEY